MQSQTQNLKHKTRRRLSHLTWLPFSTRGGKKEIPFVGPSNQGPTELAPILKSWPLVWQRENSEDRVADCSHTWNIEVFNQGSCQRKQPATARVLLNCHAFFCDMSEKTTCHCACAFELSCMFLWQLSEKTTCQCACAFELSCIFLWQLPWLKTSIFKLNEHRRASSCSFTADTKVNPLVAYTSSWYIAVAHKLRRELRT